MTTWQAAAMCLAVGVLAGCVGGGNGGGDEPIVGRDASADIGDEDGSVLMIDAEVACEFPPSQGASEPCCLSLGIDGCGAGLFCAAFDGRRQPTCYTDGSRLGDETCGADAHCASGACDAAAGRCLGGWGGPCSAEVGCAQSEPNQYLECQAESGSCQITSGRPTAGCANDSHCVDGGSCLQGHCECLPLGDTRVCASTPFGDACERDSDCEGQGEGTWRCFIDLAQPRYLPPVCINTCTDEGDCASGGACVAESSLCLVPSEDP